MNIAIAGLATKEDMENKFVSIRTYKNDVRWTSIWIKTVYVFVVVIATGFLAWVNYRFDVENKDAVERVLSQISENYEFKISE